MLIDFHVHLFPEALAGKTLDKQDYILESGALRIPDAPDDVTLTIDTLIHPDKNTATGPQSTGQPASE